MAAKIEPTEHHSAGAAAGSGEQSDQQLRAILDNLQQVMKEGEPVERDDLRPGITSYLDHEASERKAIYDRLVAIENEMKRRGSRGFARYLVAICIGVVATLAWQSYGAATKQIIATRAPELGWSPEAKQMIASWVQQLGWTKPPAGPENAAVQLSVSKMPQAAPLAEAGSETVASSSKAPAAPSLDQQQVQQMDADIAAVKQTVEQRLTAVRETVEQLAVGQDQVLREIAKLHQEILNKIPASSPQLPAGPAQKPMPAPASSSRAPIPPASSRELTPPQLPPHP